jgi:dTDP-4-amino-4,6-dideoxygalactose transaminase
VIRVTGQGNRDALKEKLAAVSIQTEVYYPRAMHEQACFDHVEGAYPISEKLCMETMALPLSGSFFPPLI